MYLSFNQIIELVNSSKASATLMDSLSPLLSTIIGGVISVFATLLLLSRQYKNNQKEIEQKEEMKKREKSVSDLREYYIQFNNYFLYLFNSYNIFFLVINKEMEYKEWFEFDVESKPYDFIEIQLTTNLYGLKDEFENFDNIVKNLNELCTPFTYLRKYKKGMELEINISQFSELFDELVIESSKFNDIIIKLIEELDLRNSKYYS